MQKVKDTGKKVWIMNYRYWEEEPNWYCCYNSLNALLSDFDTFVKDILEKDEIFLTDEEIAEYREELRKFSCNKEINIKGTDYYIWVDSIQVWGFI